MRYFLRYLDKFPRRAAQEAAAFLFIDAGERKKQIERVDDNPVQTLSEIPNLHRIPVPPLRGDEILFLFQSRPAHLKSEADP